MSIVVGKNELIIAVVEYALDNDFIDDESGLPIMSMKDISNSLLVSKNKALNTLGKKMRQGIVLNNLTPGQIQFFKEIEKIVTEEFDKQDQINNEKS